MTDELNPGPCPFCGSERVTVMTTQDVPPWPPNGYVICSGCSARGPRCENREQAIARWNAAGQDTKRLDWYLGASASPPSIEDWIRGMKEGWTPTQWRAWIDECLNAEGRQG